MFVSPSLLNSEGEHTSDGLGEGLWGTGQAKGKHSLPQRHVHLEEGQAVAQKIPKVTRCS
jgi:hypothetical protein